MTTIKNQFIISPWFPLSVFLPVFPVEVWWWLEEHTHTLLGSLPSSWCGYTHRYTSLSSSPSHRSADPGRLDLPCWRTGRRSPLLQRGSIIVRHQQQRKHHVRHQKQRKHHVRHQQQSVNNVHLVYLTHSQLAHLQKSMVNFYLGQLYLWFTIDKLVCCYQSLFVPPNLWKQSLR